MHYTLYIIHYTLYIIPLHTFLEMCPQKFFKDLKSIYRVANEGKCHHLQLLGQRPVMPLAATACQCGIYPDIDLFVPGGIGHVKVREADRDKAAQ